MYESVHRGDIDEPTGRKILDDIRGLRIRFLGDRSLEGHAWRLAKLNWPDIHQAQYIALTQLQADALVTLDDKLAAAARAFVKTGFGVMAWVISFGDILPKDWIAAGFLEVASIPVGLWCMITGALSTAVPFNVPLQLPLAS